MIAKESLSIQWLETLVQRYKKADKILIEKVIRALSLLELLKLNNLDFIFKGGTALLLLLSEPKRLSIDIDIILPTQPANLEDILERIVEQSDFISFEENVRKSHTSIKKQHFKFHYTPLTKTISDTEYILLDIVYTDYTYENKLQSQTIDSPFLIQEEEMTSVIVPTIDGLLGDKLTAFAPMTTGIPYHKGKEIEIIKQLYDIANLFDEMSDIERIYDVFTTIGAKELANRHLKELTSIDILNDIFETSLLISTRGKYGTGDFDELQKGIKNIRNFIFSEPFHIERAIVCTAKAAYLAMLLKNQANKFQRYSPEIDMREWIIQTPFVTKLNKLKKSSPESFFYWYQVYQLS